MFPSMTSLFVPKIFFELEPVLTVNAQILRRLEREAVKQGWKLPKVCTPPELMGDSNDEDESSA